jgi:hypothetical protein
MMITPEEAREMTHKVRTPGSKVRTMYTATEAEPLRKPTKKLVKKAKRRAL